MKKLLYIFATAALTMTMSCGGNSAQREQDVRDSLHQDSIKKIEAFNDSIRRDSIVKDSIRQDSLLRYRETPDLALLNLHGPVKSVTFSKGLYLETVKNATFSKEGELQSLGKFKFSRNGKGLVTNASQPSSIGGYIPDGLKITYDKNNRPIAVLVDGHEYGFKNSLTYNSQGFVATESSSGGAECYDITNNTKYTYVSTDKYGNWTARKATTTHTEINVADEEEPPLKSTKTTTETRTITYYE